MIRFATPWALLLLPLVLALLWDSYWRGCRKRASLGYPDLDLVRSAAARPALESHLPLALAALALALLVGSLARPQAVLGSRPDTSAGLDIMLCLDTSPSMQAQDIDPNRMDAAKRVSAAFVAARPDDRIGVVVFSRIAFTLCPLTVDHQSLADLIASVDTRITRSDGTALGTGLVTAVTRLKDVPGKSRVIILLTDGRSNSGEIDPLTAARMAARFGIKVYTVGVGTLEGTVLHRLNELNLVETVKVDVDLDEPTLREIASLTGGRYFRATDLNSLQAVYAEIDRLEKREAPAMARLEFRELYLWLLAPGLALLALGLVLEHTVFMEVP